MTVRRVRAGRSGNGLRRTLAAAIAILALPEAAAASHRDGFVFTFQQGTTAPEDWCKGAASLGCGGGPAITQFATWEASNRYLGAFGEETITLQGMDYLGQPALSNNRAYLSFDLILTDDWQGNGIHPAQPDLESLFTVVANRATILDTSFSNIVGVQQAYPGAYPSSSNPAGSGSTTFSTFDPESLLSAYRIQLPFSLGLPPNASCCADVVIHFAANLGPLFDQYGFYTPKWGLDNVVVSSTPIPEPMSGCLLGLGLLALGARRRRA